MAHPSGHNHKHEVGELSPCQIRTANRKLSYWPPMTCLRLAIDVESAEIPKQDFLKISADNNIILRKSLFDVVNLLESPFLKLPDPLANSDPPRKGILLRGPPIV